MMAGVQNSQINMLELMRLFLAYKFSILTYTILGALIGIAIALLSPPVYQADALIQLEEKSSGGMALSADLSGLFSDTPQSVSEIEILRSRMILGSVIADLQLDVSAAPKQLPLIGDFLSRVALPDPQLSFISGYAWHDEYINLAFLELPEPLIGEPVRLVYRGEQAFTVHLGNTQVKGKVGEPLRLPELGFALLVDQISGAPLREFILQRESFADTLKWVRENFSIAEKGKNSSILQLAFTDQNPALAATILAKISEVYLLQNMSRNAAEADNSLTFIEEQLPVAEANMRAAESAVNAYKLSQDSVDLSFETRALLEQSVQIEAKLNELTLEEQELQKRFTRAHPAYQTLLDNREQLTLRLSEIRSQSVDLPETQLEMLRLTQNLEVAQQIYLQLVNRAQELSVIKAGTIGNIRVIDSSFTFPDPVKPAKAFVVAVSTLAGLMLALGLALLRAFVARGIESQQAIEDLGVSVYAAIQKVGNGEYGKAGKPQKSRPVLAVSEPTSLAVEALRSLRTSLHFGMMDAKSSIMLMTSSRPGEGKSFVSVNLATVMAQSGQNICLVDADLRRGYLRKYFGVAKATKGLSDVLSGEANIEDVIQKDEATGVFFLPAGQYPPNPSELFMHQNFEAVCSYLDQRFDLTLMDAPPLLAVTDPVIIGKYAGMTMLVVRHMFTQTGELTAALKTLENNGLTAGGAILNAYSPKANRKGAGEYSYQYSYKSPA